MFDSTDECRGLTGDLPEISKTLSKAMESLQDRPVLYQWVIYYLLIMTSAFVIILHYVCRYCLDEYGTARRTAVVRCFVDALTRGGKLK